MWNKIVLYKEEVPYTKFLTIAKRGSTFINTVILSHLFHDEIPLGSARDANLEYIDIYEGLSIYITENLNKFHGIVNGQEATVTDLSATILFIRLQNGAEHFIHCRYNEKEKWLYFPFLINYSTTIYKCQGKNLRHVPIWFDRKKRSLGAGYVALDKLGKIR